MYAEASLFELSETVFGILVWSRSINNLFIPSVKDLNAASQ